MKKENKARNYLAFLAMNLGMIVSLPQVLAMIGLTSGAYGTLASLSGNSSLGNQISATVIIYCLVFIILCLLVSYFVLSKQNKFILVVWTLLLALLIAGYFQAKSSFLGSATPFPFVDVLLTILVIVAAIYGIKDNSINEKIKIYISENILKKNK